MGRLFKMAWLVVALAGSAGLILWMSEHGDLQSAMVDSQKPAEEATPN